VAASMDDPTPILELIDGFRRSKTLFAAVKLGIFDGVRPPGAAARRLLDACVALSLLERRGSEYINTALADKYLRSDRLESLAGYIRCANDDAYERWGQLDLAMIEGPGPLRRPSRLERLSRMLGRIFRRSKTFPDRNRDFMAGMHAFGLISSPRVAAAFDLSRFRRFVDLGGSTGHLAMALQQQYPEMNVAVFDLQPVIQLTRNYTGDRAALFAGNFFTAPLPPADLYGLGKVLHNHTEDNIRLLLGRIYSALPERGGLLLSERLLEEDRSGPLHVHMSSLNMLVSGGGTERTFSEYRELLVEAGFKTVDWRKTGAPVDAILAQK
jgi:acetylserotonin O-methyltransferase